MTHPVFKNHQPLASAEDEKSAFVAQDSTSAERARILLALLDKHSASAEMAPLAQTARNLSDQPGIAKRGIPDNEVLQKSASALLKRLEARSKPTKTRSPVSQVFANKKVIKSTIAALIHDSALPQEHPAVIAIVLENQPAKTKAAVLRELPGNKARRVQRALERISEL